MLHRTAKLAARNASVCKRQYTHSPIACERILATDKIHGICSQVFEKRGHTLDEKFGLPADEIAAILPEYDGLIVRSDTKVTADLLRKGAAGKLRIVGRAGTGVDNIDVGEASKTGVLVVNTPSGNTVSTAEFAMTHMLSLARNIPQATASLKAGRWDRKLYTGTELAGKTLGIIGLGRIGQEFAKWTKSLGMKTVGYDPILAASAAHELGIRPVSLTELFEESDFITIHTPKTNETSNLINAKNLAKCKKGVRIINCARGGIVNEADLLAAIESGHVGGAALDVFSTEPPTEEMRALITHPKVICSPHMGASTTDAQVRVAEDIASQMSDIFEQKGFHGVVNAPDISFAKSRRLMPYMFLAEQMGSLHAQLLRDTKIVRVRATLFGPDVATPEMGDSIRNAVVKGTLSSIMTTPVNYINAASLGEECGLKVSTELSTSRDDLNYDSAIKIEFMNDSSLNSRHTITGTVFKGNELRIVDVDGYHVDMIPKGNCLFFNNEDTPGALRRVTETLGKAGVNISDLILGRKNGPGTPGDIALGVISTDEPIPPSVVEEIRALPQIFNVSAVTFPELQLDQVTESSRSPLYSPSMPGERPRNPEFSSGPCKKRPGYRLDQLPKSSLGRSHRSALGKGRLAKAINDSKRILGLPDDYLLGIVPASDTGAYEMAMWNMLGERPVDMCYWESFGKGWFGDATSHLKLKDVREFTADYGKLPDLSQTSGDHDICFTWNGTTSGVCVPNGDWIASDRTGLTLNDATSAAFAFDLPWDKLDVTTYSWQKVLGGEGGHGVIILSPRAVERLESFTPEGRPLPKIFRMVKKGKVDRAIFEGSTINTPSMLAVEDYIDALEWADRIGGLPALVSRARDNLSVVENFVENNEWIDFLAEDPSVRSPTSICLKLDLDKAQVKSFVKLLEDQDVALDIGSYRDAPAGLRIWGGATVEKEDLEMLMPWLSWAYSEIKSQQK